jgi:hypothetical protein
VEHIQTKIDPMEFKSDEWLLHNKKYKTAISGEVKIACTIRILAGASYLDLLLAYNLSHHMLYEIFHETINWINKSFEFALPNYIKYENTNKLQQLALAFSDRSDGIINGCIGALDGVAIRIRSPWIERDEVPDPGNYYCRKGFFALNVQAICDADKRIIWLSTGHKGSTHDSVAFIETKLAKLLEDKKDYLYNNRLFIVGDSAYALKSYMMVPYPNAESNSIHDDFNYYHSRTRIYIECTFGEMIMRWGVFWKKLNFKLENNGPIINACSHLHNFLIDERLRNSNVEKDDKAFFNHYDHHKDDSSIVGVGAFPLVSDNNEPSVGGRPPRNDLRGTEIRDNIATALRTFDLSRPLQDGMKYNCYGHIYMDK